MRLIVIGFSILGCLLVIMLNVWGDFRTMHPTKEDQQKQRILQSMKETQRRVDAAVEKAMAEQMEKDGITEQSLIREAQTEEDFHGNERFRDIPVEGVGLGDLEFRVLELERAEYYRNEKVRHAQRMHEILR